MAQYILNAFALNMIKREGLETVHQPILREIDLSIAKSNLSDGEWISAVGHTDTAAVFTEQLGQEIPANRITVSLEENDRCLVGQYTGPRLPEGCKSLPEGAKIEWWLVVI